MQAIFDNFWNVSSENAGNPAETIADFYAPDFRLNLENNGGVSLQAGEELPVTEVLNTARANLLTAYPNLTIQQINVNASGNYVFVNVEVQTGRDDAAQPVEGVLSYHIVNGVIDEERWTSNNDLFLSAAPE